MKENTTFATELLSEVCRQARRWCIAFCIMVVLEVLTIAGFMWYLSLPTDTETVSVENEDGNANYIGDDLNGDLNNGKSDGNKDAQSDKEQK